MKLVAFQRRSKMMLPIKSFSLVAAEHSAEIEAWINQFPLAQRSTALDLVLKLRFITTDVYCEWLKSTLLKLPEDRIAVYAVRKFDQNEIRALWDEAGNSIPHEIKSMGSEDLVRSVLATLIKFNPKRFCDHPSINELRSYKPTQIVLVDDSIGSGKRILDYIRVMLGNRSFLSWWSYGVVRFQVLAFARNEQADKAIINGMPGSDHPKRRYPKSKKIKFSSYRVYRANDVEKHWGNRFDRIIDLCRSVKEIPRDRKLGFGDTMSNILFYHSVPNNIPGILWYQTPKWQALFPHRVLPVWANHLLENSPVNSLGHGLQSTLIELLRQVKRGVRKESTLSRELGFDVSVVHELLSSARESGFLTESNRLTRTGVQVLWEARESILPYQYDRSLYIPKKWCVD